MNYFAEICPNSDFRTIRLYEMQLYCKFWTHCFIIAIACCYFELTIHEFQLKFSKYTPCEILYFKNLERYFVMAVKISEDDYVNGISKEMRC
ncbi:hypothetical protein RhiirA5_414938 [Rhizophagus irregularis]|uniref:Uncharacterized protein n=1 Tax=Rhizophagus irregularis TaxID=588596 RepID=A0A2N0PT12_9GLOM|nr:hypothetical protein RhiirA5_414938 [Rhizophagus irregularis]